MKTPHLALVAMATILTLAFPTTQAQVVISEICTENTRYEDEDAESPDWFELHNTGDAEVNLAGWQLTTSDTAETVWTIQHLTLGPDAVRLFFASEKDRPGTEETADSFRPYQLHLGERWRVPRIPQSR